MSEFTYAFDEDVRNQISAGAKVLKDNGEEGFDCIMVDLAGTRPLDCSTILDEANKHLSDNGIVFLLYPDIESFTRHTISIFRHAIDNPGQDNVKLNPAKYMTTLYLSLRGRKPVNKTVNLSSGIDRVIGVFAKGFHVKNKHSSLNEDKHLVFNDKFSSLIEGNRRTPLENQDKILGGQIVCSLLHMIAPVNASDERKGWDHVLISNFERPTLQEIKDFAFGVDFHFVFSESNMRSLTQAKIEAAVNDVSLSFHDSCPSQSEINTVLYGSMNSDDDEEGYMAEDDGQLKFT